LDELDADRQFCISSVSAGRVSFWALFWRFVAPMERPALPKLLMQVRGRAPGSVHACEADPDPLRHVRSCSL
jgi:hypothetical protein